jgi:putative DNA primase/helicase
VQPMPRTPPSDPSPPNDPLRQLLSQLDGVRPAGDGWTARCPAHDDRNPSLSITVADSGKILLHCHAGCETADVIHAAGFEPSLLNGTAASTRPTRKTKKPQSWGTKQAAIAGAARAANGKAVDDYDYCDDQGDIKLCVIRIAQPKGKTFRPIHPSDGRWHLGDPEGLLPLFNLPAVIAADLVLIAEGEGCALAAREYGTTATTSAHGSNSAHKSDWSALQGKDIVIWPDNDEPGRKYAEDVADELRQLDPEAEIHIVAPSGLDAGDDIVDWISARKAEGLDHADIAEALAILLEGAAPWPDTSQADSTHSTYSTGPSVQSDDWPAPKPLSSRAKPMPFPLEAAFPDSCGKLRDFVEAVAISYQVPVDLPALMALATLALPVARTIEIVPLPDWKEVVAIYVLLLLSSGERKSAVFSTMVGPIYSWQDAQESEMAPAIRQFENEHKITEEKIRTKRRASAKSENDGDDSLAELIEALARMKKEKPKPPSLIATEATTEAIADMLIQNNERGMLAAPEGDAFDVMLGRYGQGRPNFGLWLSGHAGDAMAIRRKGRDTLKLHRPALCVAMCVQPSVALELLASPDAEGRGVVARFLFGVPDSDIGYREIEPPSIPRELTDWYGTKVHQLLDRPVPATPDYIRLDTDAAALLHEFRKQVEVDLRPGGDLANRMSWGSKLAGAILRIAGVLHVVAHGGRGDGYIDGKTMTAALAWDPYLRHHERLANSLANKDPALGIAERIVDWLRRNEVAEFSQNECFNGVRCAQIKKSKDLAPGLDLLTDYGWIRVQPPPPSPPGKAGRKPSQRYSVNPDAHSHGARQAPHNTHNTHNRPSDAPGEEGGQHG